MVGLTSARARRIALSAQGLHRVPPEGRTDLRHLRRTVDRLRAVQLDSVNVVVRAHYMPFFSRLGSYDMDRLDRWFARSGEVFEYWGHRASVMPAELHPLMRWRMEAIRPWGRVGRILEEHPEMIDRVYAEVASRPLTISELPDAGDRTGPWWGNAPGKVALEWLFAKGKITAYRTGNFVRVYDLPERALPPDILRADPVDKAEAYRILLLEAARALGVGTAADLADYFVLHVPTARRTLADLVAEGELEQVDVEGWRQVGYLHPAAKVPRRVSGRALLSPFDSLMWSRPRVERLFDFEYRIEIYVPASQRRYGYYVYPLLVGESFVARLDLKADRKSGSLLVLGAFAEHGIDREAVSRVAIEELTSMAQWLGLARLEIGSKGDLVEDLRAAA